ncbi:hypothetical protein EHO58_18890 [Leptospira selangorensis]|nr:hypothetical protein EHO58_18890 [Leptospira selangorensis]
MCGFPQFEVGLFFLKTCILSQKSLISPVDFLGMADRLRDRGINSNDAFPLDCRDRNDRSAISYRYNFQQLGKREYHRF